MVIVSLRTPPMQCTSVHGAVPVSAIFIPCVDVPSSHTENAVVLIAALGFGYTDTSTVSVTAQLPAGGVHTTLYFCFFTPGPFHTIFNVGLLVFAPAVMPLAPLTGVHK